MDPDRQGVRCPALHPEFSDSVLEHACHVGEGIAERGMQIGARHLAADVFAERRHHVDANAERAAGMLMPFS